MVVLKPGMNYVNTKVSFENSKHQIKQMLKKNGCDKIADFEDTSTGLSKIIFEKDNVSFIVEFPITYVERGRKFNKTKDLDMKVSGRIIHDRIKSLLIAIEINYLNFTQAMMPFIALQSSNGMEPMETVVMEQHDILIEGRFEFDPTKLLTSTVKEDITIIEGSVS